MPLTDAMVPQLLSLPPVESTDSTSSIPPTPTAPTTAAANPKASVPRHHPLGVKPLGNRYLADSPDASRAAGYFQMLPGELLMSILERLDALSLTALGSSCKFLYAFCDFDELWKSLAIETKGWQPKAWHGTWRRTWRFSKTQSPPETDDRAMRIDCGSVFSDVLHRPFECSGVALEQFAANIPKANQIARMGDLSYGDFAATWSATPFVLTDCIRDWPVLREWSLDALRAAHGETVFRAESVDWPYGLYDQYLRDCADESPLYLFDRKFVEKMGLRVGRPAAADTATATATATATDAAYWKPACFGPDLFESLGADRPAHRWLIVGPARSGSTFHKDPNGTSAWNAVVQGAKYWIMFPPGAAVPGVYVSADRSEVTSPLSIAEWLLAFHAEARQQPGCIEGVCGPGEILHVPSGWWHLVVNLEAGIALTQNFVPAAHLATVLLFLRDRPEQVTGFARTVTDPYGLFVERLGAEWPAELAAAQEAMAQRDGRRKRTWEEITRVDAAQTRGDCVDDGKGDEKRPRQGAAGGFTFGFGGIDDDDSEPDVS